MVTARFATPPNSTDPCTSNCTCMPNEMNCRGVIPYTVPEPIKTVVLTGLKPTDFSPARFCYVSWTNVKELIIESVLAVGLRYFHLEGRIFECLDQIETFRFSSGALYRVVDTTFSGLSNLNTFDLSGCKMLLWEDVASTLSVPSNFPNLKRLIFSQTGMHQLLVLDNEFIKALSLRPLEYLDLSFTLLNWDFSDPGKLCDTLTTLKYEGAQVLHSKEFANCSVCQSLRILDSGDKFYKNLIQNVTCKNAIQYFRPISPFFNDMQVLYMNNIVTPAEMYSLRNCIWVLWPHTQLTELHFAHNYLPNFDVELYNTKLETLNLGHNQMKSVGRKAFRFLVSLETLDLSDNILGQSQAMFDTFSTLFSRNANLTNLDLSGNLITSLPSATFATNTNLEHLVLADNLLEQVRLNMSQLVDLKILDLKDNSIKSLNKASRDFLDELYEKQSQNHNGSFVQVLLDGNPFDCSCDSLDFVYWFAESPMFISTRHKYFCSSNDQQVTMDGDAINAATEDCARIKRRRLMIQLLSTLTPAAMIATIIALLVCHRRRKIMLLRKRFRDGIQKLREDFSRFPVFVSYSSDDAELAKSQILRTFQVIINPYLTDGFSHHYQLDESTFIFRGHRSDFYFLTHSSKQTK